MPQLLLVSVIAPSGLNQMTTRMLWLWLLPGFLAVTTSAQTVLDAGIVTRSTVDEYADVSLDVREVRNYRSDSRRITALWDDGLHFTTKDGHRGSLAKLASELTTGETPLQIIHQEGVRAAYGSYRPNFTVDNIHNIIASSPISAADAIVASVLWMYAAHLLFQGVHTCQLRSSADNPNYIEEGTYGLDEFIALWMGRDLSGRNSLYGWTQDVSERFGLNVPEAKANTAIKLLYQQGAAALTLPNACTKENPDTVSQLWNVAVQLTNEMMKPLFQSLLRAIEEKDSTGASIYSSALIPHIYRCRPSLFKHLSDAMRNGDILQLDPESTKIELRDVALSCFGISCSSLSMNAYALSCDEEEETMEYEIAGYRTRSKDAANVSPLSCHLKSLMCNLARENRH